MTLNELEDIITGLSRAEKARILQWLIRDLGDAFPNIESSPDILGGEARIVRTRIPVWVLEEMRRQGAREADILLSYPMLRAEDLASAWAYVRLHRDEIEQAISENEMA